MHIKTVQYKFVLAVQLKKLQKAITLALSRPNEFRALIISIDNRYMDLIRILIENGWDINERRSKDGYSPLHCAVVTHNWEVVAELLKRGACRNAFDGALLTPLARNLKMKVCGKGLNVYQELTKGMTDAEFRETNQRNETILHFMSRNCTIPVEIYKEVMDKGINVNAREEYFGRVFLQDMVIFFQNQQLVVKVAEMALEKGLKINQRDNYGNGLLHRIAAEEREIVMQWASLKKHIRIRVKNQNGQSPMWLAAKRGNIKIMRLLFKMGETCREEALEHSSGERMTMLQYAESRGQGDVAFMIRQEIGGEKTMDGEQNPRSLMELAKGEIRDCLARQGVNIMGKVSKLPLPRVMQDYLLQLDYSPLYRE